MILSLQGLGFVEIGLIEVRRSLYGDIDLIPASTKFDGKYSRHTWGIGPFCRFTIPADIPTSPGVYAFVVEGTVKYVGIGTKDVRHRVSQYRRVYDRQQYARGPQTTCRVNACVADAAIRGASIALYVMTTPTPRIVEQRLIAELDPEWNRKA